ncbi:MAG: hypothetical protein A2506_07750, partial [Elusimicrobia bacterium RIFOXYD12_FULL_66_9]
MKPSFLSRLKNVLLAGLFIVAPASLTFILISWLVSGIEGTLSPVVTRFIGRPVPGLGLITALLIILTAGMLGTNVFGRHIIALIEELLLKIPGFNWVYLTVKQLSTAFRPDSASDFRGVVLIEYPRPEVYSLGFVTNELTLGEGAKARRMVCVYVPTNHIYVGDHVLVPVEKVFATGLSQRDGAQAVLSAGASLPSQLNP